MRVDVRLLGGFEVRVDGVRVPDDAWGRQAPAALVKVLALAPGHRLRREQVIDAAVARPARRPGGAAAAQGRALRAGRPSAAESLVLAGESVALFPDGRGRRSTSTSSTRRWRPPARETWDERRRRSRPIAASCCRTTSTSRGPRRPGSASASGTWSCCTCSGGGSRRSRSTRSTRSPTSSSCRSRWPAATVVAALRQLEVMEKLWQERARGGAGRDRAGPARGGAGAAGRAGAGGAPGARARAHPGDQDDRARAGHRAGDRAARGLRGRSPCSGPVAWGRRGWSRRSRCVVRRRRRATSTSPRSGTPGWCRG